MAWEGSKRRDGLPRWWPVTVRRILARDPVCRCEGCPKCFAAPLHGQDFEPCRRPSAEVDHIIPGGDHRDENLRGICRPCHQRKSSGEGVAARAARRQPTGFHSDPHPSNL